MWNGHKPTVLWSLTLFYGMRSFDDLVKVAIYFPRQCACLHAHAHARAHTHATCVSKHGGVKLLWNTKCGLFPPSSDF